MISSPTLIRYVRVGVTLLLCLLMQSCGFWSDKTSQANSYRPSSYQVQPGDTLYSIAFRYGMDHAVLAGANGIRPPFTIYPGQKLDLSRKAARVIPPTRQANRQQPAIKVSERKKAPLVPRSPRNARRSTGWQWPASGPLLTRFKAGGSGKKGVFISAKPGIPVRAASSGTVVYSGSGLKGYGQLIILKHNSSLLSAYGHNRKILVQEGDQVRKGQQIAEVGFRNSGTSGLHFEIRRGGKAVDPLAYLPGQPG